MEKKRMSTGCLVALIVGGVLGALVLVHLAIALYFLQQKFEVKAPVFSEPSPKAAPRDRPFKPSDATPSMSVMVKARSADGAFERDGAEQLFGYYQPTSPINEGIYRISAIALGSQDDFKAVKSAEDVVGWAPVMVLAVEANDAKARRIVILPTRYSVVGDRISFSGHHDAVGDVAFEGTIKLDRIRGYIDRGEASEQGVMTGRLTVNGQVHNVELTYFPGD